MATTPPDFPTARDLDSPTPSELARQQRRATCRGAASEPGQTAEFNVDDWNGRFEWQRSDAAEIRHHAPPPGAAPTALISPWTIARLAAIKIAHEQDRVARSVDGQDGESVHGTGRSSVESLRPCPRRRVTPSLIGISSDTTLPPVMHHNMSEPAGAVQRRNDVRRPARDHQVWRSHRAEH